MGKYLIKEETLTDIANAIRFKTGKSDPITPLEMPEEILSISGGGDEPDYFWIKNTSNDDGTIHFSYGNTSAPFALKYSTDKTHWTDIVFSSTGSGTISADIAISAQEVLFIKNDSHTLSDMLHYFIITCDKEHSAGGRINSLINDLDGKGCYSFAFAYLFSFDDKLVDASALVLNERVAKSCYDHMFSHCTGLRKVPQLPALSLEYSCYQNMFEGCQKLEEIPELPATTLADSCYRAMFFGCTSLVDASIELPAQILCNYCYKDMFSNCTNLTIPPILTAANYFAAQAYSWMFNACTSLTTAPSLPTANINDKDLDGDSVYSCFAHMFQHCRALTTPPALHSTTLPSSIWADGCYEEMFYGCSSLKVYSTSGEGHDKAWHIPANGVLSSTAPQSEMFYGTDGDVAPNFPGEAGQQYTYYTQNEPV